VLYGAVSKDLHNEILKNDTSFIDAWNALVLVCGQDLVITFCAAYRKVNQMKYQPGASLTDHIANFKRAFTKLADQTANHPQEFGTVTLFADTELDSLVQACYNIKPFNLKTVTKRITIEAVWRVNWNENQNSVMFTSNTTRPSKSSKKKGKKAAGPNPKTDPPPQVQNRLILQKNLEKRVLIRMH
jgi:hypothetical protein